VLGDHVAQKGSLVAPDRLRFDFSHPKTDYGEEIERVEDIANDLVLQNSPVTTRVMALDDARQSGARALFGEKYGDEVRVVAMGDGSGNAMGWSVELCGGTHVRRTGDIGIISVVGDSGVASGVRRIEALTGKTARANANDFARLAKATASELRVPVEDVPNRIAALLDERKRLERDLSDAKKNWRWAAARATAPMASAMSQCEADGAGGGRHRPERPAQPCRRGQEAGRFRHRRDRRVAGDGKAGIVVGVTEDLVKRFNAVDLVRKGAEVLGGKGGGGRPDMAQAGGPDGSKADAALAAIEAAIV